MVRYFTACYGRLEYDFLVFFGLLPVFPGTFLLFVLFRLRSSHVLLSCKYVLFLCRLYPASSRSSFVVLVLVCVLRVCGILVPGTLAPDLPNLIRSRFLDCLLYTSDAADE